MKHDEAQQLVEQTFKSPFSKDNFDGFIRNLLQGIEPSSTSVVAGAQLPKGFEDHIVSITRLGKYVDPAGDVLDALAVKLKNPASLDRARTRQRNLMAHYLTTRNKDAALVAFYSDDSPDWRFSFVRLAYETDISDDGRIKAKREFTPARRFSFLVGETEPSHTAQQQLAPLLEKTERLAIADIEAAFNIETVTNEFFERYKELFLRIKDELDQQIKLNKKVEQEFERCQIDTVSFSKKLLGQIVFLYFIQKKGWLGVKTNAKWGEGDKDFLFNLFEDRSKKNFFKEILEPFFYEALALERAGDFYKELDCKVPFLNGGLFEPINGYLWKTTPLNIDNKVFGEIFKVCNLYNFTVREDEPLEKEVAVDPEMLGKVFENLLEIRDRRSKGAYYTPREIVHYMCQESLIQYLDAAVNEKDTLVPKSDIETLVRRGDVFLENDLAKDAGRKSGEYGLPESVRNSASKLDRALAEIKICDPAIGSGAFPVGMMTEIVKVRNVFTHMPDFGDKPFRTAYDFKWHCIENNIYGVDIEPSAVEIAKLRLWLSLVVDEDNYDHIRPLPNLDYRIVCGNSLLSVEKNLFNLALYSELEIKKNQYFGSTSQRNKDVLRREIDLIIEQLTDGNRTFDFEIYFSEVFSTNSGFDVIIANPPYIKEYVDRAAFDGLRGSPYYQGKMDIWYFFACKSIDLARPETGIVTFIAQNNWVTSHGAAKMRNKVLADTRILLLIDFIDYKVFEAGIQTMIMMFQKAQIPAKYTFDFRRLYGGKAGFEDMVSLLNRNTTSKTEFLSPAIDRLAFINQTLTFSSSRIEGIIKKLLDQSTFKLQANEVANGIHHHHDKVNRDRNEILGGSYKVGTGIFVLTNAEKEQLRLSKKELALVKPSYTTREIFRWWANPENQEWVIYTDSSFRDGQKIDNFPRIKTHLDQFRQVITSDNKPYGLHRARNEQFFLGEKIVVPRKSTYPAFAIIDFPSYVSAAFYLIKTDRISQKFLVALLNSKVVTFWLKNKGKMQGSNFQIDKEPLLDLPLLSPDKQREGRIVALVDMILKSKVKGKTDIEPIETEIDKMIYDLYELSAQEIEVIEDNLKV